MNAAKDNSLRVDGATLFYRVRGSGPMLLILPGGDGDADTADALRHELIDRYMVITYDRRGMSRSKIDGPGQSLTIATHSDDAHRLLAALTNQPVFVFGSSIGALVGLDLVARHPEQVAIFVRGHTQSHERFVAKNTEESGSACACHKRADRAAG